MSWMQLSTCVETHTHTFHKLRSLVSLFTHLLCARDILWNHETCNRLGVWYRVCLAPSCLAPEWRSHFMSIIESAKRLCCGGVSKTKGWMLDLTGPWGQCCQLSSDPSTTSVETVSFPGGSDGKESACNAGDPGLIPGLGSWRREWQPIPVFWRGEAHGQKSLAGLQSMRSQRVRHDWTTDTFTSLFYWTCTQSRLWESWGARHLLAAWAPLYWVQVRLGLTASLGASGIFDVKCHHLTSWWPE